jgi:AraC-like DNA-binding protein
MALHWTSPCHTVRLPVKHSPDADASKAVDGLGRSNMAVNSKVPHGGVEVRVYPPCENLKAYVTFFYLVEAEGPLADFLYPEWGNVRFARTGSWSVAIPDHYPPGPQGCHLYGPTDRTGRVETGGGQIFGFGLTPLGWHRLFGSHAGEMANRVVPLENRLGMPETELRRWVIDTHNEADLVKRFEEMLTTAIGHRPAIKASVLAVDRALRSRPATAAEFALRAGLTYRILHRICLQAFGFPPKRLLMLQRFLDALGHVRSAVGEPIGKAIGETYFDASHFYRDFRHFMAMSPREYFSAPRPLMGAAAQAQSAAGVTLSFELPPASI